jgi:hypothetical protein
MFIVLHVPYIYYAKDREIDYCVSFSVCAIKIILGVHPSLYML